MLSARRRARVCAAGGGAGSGGSRHERKVGGGASQFAGCRLVASRTRRRMPEGPAYECCHASTGRDDESESGGKADAKADEEEEEEEEEDEDEDEDEEEEYGPSLGIAPAPDAPRFMSVTVRCSHEAVAVTAGDPLCAVPVPETTP